MGEEDDISVSYLQNLNNNIFDVEYQIFNLDEFQLSLQKLLYKDSFIKLRFDSIERLSYVISAKIKDKDIHLLNDMQIGMLKQDFFEKLFNAEYSNFEKMDTINNADERGEIDQYYIFEADTLKEIIIKSNGDIPLDL
ncbi:MAG: hypothetical protein LBJ63_06695 [Prevotellaceae bacterium]|nr:hypothetical protein [Prevotellaceae bacterium]